MNLLSDFAVLKKDLMATLDKEVKSLDDDNWKFEGPRSRIHVVSSGGGQSIITAQILSQIALLKCVTLNLSAEIQY